MENIIRVDEDCLSASGTRIRIKMTLISFQQLISLCLANANENRGRFSLSPSPSLFTFIYLFACFVSLYVCLLFLFKHDFALPERNVFHRIGGIDSQLKCICNASGHISYIIDIRIHFVSYIIDIRIYFTFPLASWRCFSWIFNGFSNSRNKKCLHVAWVNIRNCELLRKKMRIKMCVQFASFIGYLIQTFFYIIFFVVVYFVCVLIWSELMAHHIPGSLWVFYCLINSVRVLLIT